MKYSVILLAAGRGKRTQLNYNKVFYRFADQEVLLQKTAKGFLVDADCAQVVIVTTPEEEKEVRSLFHDERVQYTYGGKERQDSVYNGLQLVTEEVVMIHDGARCFISTKTIDDCKRVMQKEKACLVMVPVIDTIKQVEAGYVVHTPVRAQLYAAQTPQVFRTELIQSCYEQGLQNGFVASDDASLVERFSSVRIKVVMGEYQNIKVTTANDVQHMEAFSKKERDV